MTPSQTAPDTRRVGGTVIGTYIDALDWDEVIPIILSWAERRDAKSVTLCNVHSAVTAIDDAALAHALVASDMVLPDGAPIAWMLRRKGFSQPRIPGPDLMLRLCQALQQHGIPMFLFGSSQSTLTRLQQNLEKRFPKLIIAGALSPRFGDWSEKEQVEYVQIIRESGAGIVFVGLGCPKQEIWMIKHSREIPGVLIGVGAAFDFHAGTVRRAPEWAQRLGLEWLHRLYSEPRRLWKRYLTTNSRFIMLSINELLTK